MTSPENNDTTIPEIKAERQKKSELHTETSQMELMIKSR